MLVDSASKANAFLTSGGPGKTPMASEGLRDLRVYRIKDVVGAGSRTAPAADRSERRAVLRFELLRRGNAHAEVAE